MTADAPTQGSPPRARTLTASRITVLIISASTPLATVIGTAPLGFAFGGPSLPAMYVASGVLILLFCVGYTQMSRRITRPGAFYSYITRGLGRPAGVASSWLALLAYSTFLAGCFAIAPYYGNLIIEQQFGIDVPWPVYALFLFVTIGVAAYLKIDFSAKILAFIVALEVLCLLVLSVVMLARGGTDLLPAETFSPDVAFSPGFGVALVFAIMSFVGFESAALYAPETKNPRKAIPRATYVSVAIITIVYGLTTWLAVGASGVDGVQDQANLLFGDFYFSLSDQYVGAWLTTTMAILMLISQWAVGLAILNATARYTHALSHERLLPSALGATHPRFRSPHVAVLVLLGICAAIIAIGGAVGLDPYLDISSVTFGIGIVGIVAIQAAACLSVMVFFRRDSEFHWWKTLLAPGIGLLGLGAAVYLMVSGFEFVTGKQSAWVGNLPWLLVLATLGGAVYGLWLRKRHHARYEMLGAGDTTSEFDELVDADAWNDSGDVPAAPTEPARTNG